MTTTDNPASSARLYRADGSPRPVGVVGWPVEHSLSPVFQDVAFAAHNLPHRYQKWAVAPQDIAAFLAQARQDDYLGLNLTVPHKRAGWEAAAAHSEEAEITGAVNTLLLEEPEGWLGHNTDVAGFLEALRDLNFDPNRKRTMVIGAGGAARAVVMALAQTGAIEIAVVNRSWENAAQLVGELAQTFPNSHIYAAPLDPAAWPYNRNPRALVVNASSHGLLSPDEPFPIDADEMAGRDADRHTIFFDLTYGDTPFLRAVAPKAAHVLDGLSMLVYQGALAFEWWTGLSAPRGEMLKAARAALAERSQG